MRIFNFISDSKRNFSPTLKSWKILPRMSPHRFLSIMNEIELWVFVNKNDPSVNNSCLSLIFLVKADIRNKWKIDRIRESHEKLIKLTQKLSEELFCYLRIFTTCFIFLFIFFFTYFHMLRFLYICVLCTCATLVWRETKQNFLLQSARNLLPRQSRPVL